MSTWPSTLPHPLSEGYSVSPQTQVARTEMEVGTPRARRRSAVRFDHISIGFSLTDDQLELFRDWFDATGSSTDIDTAQAGGASTITLAAAASATDDTYNGSVITLVTGTGSGQSRLITDYVGSTRVATVGTAWTTQPDATTRYDISGGTQGGAGWFSIDLKGAGGTVTAEARFTEPWQGDLESQNRWRITGTLEVRYA